MNPLLLEAIALGLAFGIILLLGNLRVPLWFTMAMATVTVLLGSVNRRGALVVAARASLALDTWELVATVALITLLAGILKNFGLVEPLSRGLAGTLRSPRLAFALIPGLLGCLPVPGGAGISAPMVDKLGQRLGFSPARIAAANLLFRHAWYFVFPFGPSLILAARLGQAEVARLISLQWPVTVLTLLALEAFFWGRPGPQADAPRPWREDAKELFLFASPVALGVLLFLAFRVPLPLSLLAGTAVGCGIAWRRRSFSWRLLAQSLDWELTLATELILIFAALIRASPVVTVLASRLPHLLTPTVTFLILPLLLGFVMANPVAAVGVGLPLLLPLRPAEHNPLAYVCLVYGLAFESYLLSPLHMCLVQTNRYYGVRASQVYPYLLPSVAITVAGILGLFFWNR